MAFKKKNGRKCSVLLLLIFLWMTEAKLSQDNKTHLPETKSTPKLSDGAALVFADEFKITLERYLFGICPQSFKFRWSQMAVTVKGKNTTTVTCDLDTDQQDLAGRLATLALRAHSAVRSDCSRFGAALANTLGELARTAANRHAMSAAVNEANKKRKLSKSQKAKIQAKQRTALAVKKKAAAAAAAAAAKMAS
ncbi:PREDICTED: uncharacterized protein LOC106122776 isoform X2 [Papilio xuthus]|uniref:Uncharacterized protein LOC106122776 isoform X2 n=1 Tax=Papilio xuthus TaxID=66420 RepID=A0AAJ7EEM5_PAPXU|nr:PREDICTED: uncharacterized protein LOC106122776 isoform X2 [Papilio xuthus]